MFTVQGADSVIACIYNAESTSVEIEASWNTGSPRNNRPLADVRLINVYTSSVNPFFFGGGGEILSLTGRGMKLRHEGRKRG